MVCPKYLDQIRTIGENRNPGTCNRVVNRKAATRQGGNWAHIPVLTPRIRETFQSGYPTIGRDNGVRHDPMERTGIGSPSRKFEDKGLH